MISLPSYMCRVLRTIIILYPLMDNHLIPAYQAKSLKIPVEHKSKQWNHTVIWKPVRNLKLISTKDLITITFSQKYLFFFYTIMKKSQHCLFLSIQSPASAVKMLRRVIQQLYPIDIQIKPISHAKYRNSLIH